jgi:hypothetical protein
MSIPVIVDVYDFGTIKEARVLGGKYAAQGTDTKRAVEQLRERLPLNELPAEPEFRVVEHKVPGIRE